MSKTILFPVDINNAEAAVRPLAEALAMLGTEGVLHVVTVLPSLGFSQITNFFPKGYEKAHMAEVGKLLVKWVDAHVPDEVEVHPHVLHGAIYDEILRAANKLAVDVIVMGAHRPELSDYLLGPNAARVVRHARQSVYVVRS
ncbi:universal stress protein [Sagittula salina]|uniref:Universal stress protein n=1 Tax=Sagittula salina TaxID=2820268 RepID=A0A940MW10_9RHOB|nr:universal stress protein [Sagittula salina]MBP0483899.1 universal stress protein [Sagittula salina]